MNANAGISPTSSWKSHRSARRSTSRQKGGSFKWTSKLAQIASAVGRWLAVLLGVLWMMTAQGCWLASAKPPPLAPPPPQCPLVECLDRLMTPHPGVDVGNPRTCADAYIIAVDALTGLRASQQLHAELIACVREFNRNASPQH